MNAPDFLHQPFSVDYTADGTVEVILAGAGTSCQAAGTGWVTDLVWSDGTRHLPA